jgi:hypothetical protein
MIDLLYYMYLDIEVARTLESGSSIGTVIRSFGSTIDYIAWIILFALYEIQTAIIGPRGFTGATKWLVSVIGLVCYSALVYAAYTFVDDFNWYGRFETHASETACELVDGAHYFLNEKEAYVLLTSDNCAELERGPILMHREEATVITPETLIASHRLGMVSAANGVAWLLLVLLTQAEILFERRSSNGVGRPSVVVAVRFVLYFVLFADAVYWALYGNLIDAWDAFLWLGAMAMIDLNLFRLKGQGKVT